jgi:hypothetical protein
MYLVFFYSEIYPVDNVLVFFPEISKFCTCFLPEIYPVNFVLVFFPRDLPSKFCSCFFPEIYPVNFVLVFFQRFTQYLASNNCTFNLGSFIDKAGVQGKNYWLLIKPVKYLCVFKMYSLASNYG